MKVSFVEPLNRAVNKLDYNNRFKKNRQMLGQLNPGVSADCFRKSLRFGQDTSNSVKLATETLTDREIWSQLTPVFYEGVYTILKDMAVEEGFKITTLNNFLRSTIKFLDRIATNNDLAMLIEQRKMLPPEGKMILENILGIFPESARQKKLDGEVISGILQESLNNLERLESEKETNLNKLLESEWEKIMNNKARAMLPSMFTLSLTQLLSTFIQNNKKMSQRTIGNFFNLIEAVGQQENANVHIKQTATVIKQLKNDIKKAIENGTAICSVEPGSPESFRMRLSELYDPARPDNPISEMKEDQFKAIDSVLRKFEKNPNPNSSNSEIDSRWLEIVLFEVPWKPTPASDITLEELYKVINKSHYGLEKSKKEFANHLALTIARQEDLPKLIERRDKIQAALEKELAEPDDPQTTTRTKMLKEQKEKLDAYIRGENEKSPILCFVGPAGTGKTSLAIAGIKALGRKPARISMGGVDDEAEIRGHRRTYIGAMYGRVIAGFKKAGSINPGLVIDEVDKIGQNGFRGNPAHALLEVLDPEQNRSFSDHYLGEVEYPVSGAFFVTTANELETIPGPLRDRMKIIQFPGYNTEEKIQIAKHCIIPKTREAYLLSKEEFGLDIEPLNFSDKELRYIIERYTAEQGVREIERVIGEIAKALKLSRKQWKDGLPPKMTPKNIAKWLGPRKYEPPKPVNPTPEIGHGNGLFYSSGGVRSGGTLPIDVSIAVHENVNPDRAGLYLGDGRVKGVTGNLKGIMEESVDRAFAYINTHAEELGIEDLHDKRIEVYVATEDSVTSKDGPSAGAIIAATIISELTKRPLPGDLAVTGECTLKGKVLPIGGVPEKLTGAYEEGIKRVIIPKENEPDIKKLPKKVRKGLDIKLVSNLPELMEVIWGKPVKASKQEAEAAASPTFSGLRKVALPLSKPLSYQ